MLKAIVLDFDGVILESVDIKTRAFRVLFQDHPAHIEQIVRFHLENGGLSRYEKFAIVYRDYLKKPLTDSDKERLARVYSDLIREEMLSCSFVPGALEFLTKMAAQVPLFIVSGTPEMELRGIVRQRGLAGYFRNVYGSPKSKTSLLREILAVNGWRSAEVVFIGDSLTDSRAADAVGMAFIGRVPKHGASPFPDSVWFVVSDLQNCLSQWNTMAAQFS